VVSCQVFGSLDDYLWKLSYKWATWRYNNKPKRWIVGRYFGKFNKFRNDRWVFGDRGGAGACLVKFSWTAIRRHVLVTGAASPDDPALAGYWTERRKKVKPPLDSYTELYPVPAHQAGRDMPAVRGPPCLTPTSHPSLPISGNNGCTSPARR
jgi:RNA-directed DNA polymerase